MQYLHWAWNFLQGDFGHSFEWNKPVRELIGERIGLTILISTCTLIFTWMVSVPIGIYSAVKQYSWMDYFLDSFWVYRPGNTEFLCLRWFLLLGFVRISRV